MRMADYAPACPAAAAQQLGPDDVPGIRETNASNPC
jgi:hypothetical protein